MNYHLLFTTFVIFSSFLSYSKGLYYEVYVRPLYSNGGIISIICVSNQDPNPYSFLARKDISSGDSSVHWSIKPGEFDHDTKQKCSVIDETLKEYFVLTAFDGSWKLDEIIWETYTYDDFIFDQQEGKRSFYWAVSEEGIFLQNSKTGKYALVVPTNNRALRDRVFVSNLFDDDRRMALVCVPKEASHGGNKLADEKGLHRRDAAGWSILSWDYHENAAHTCIAGWESKTDEQKTEHYFFTAFEGSWRLDKILHESYTRNDFTFNPYSRKRNYLWGVSEKGLSLYNFKTKEYRVLVENI